MDVDEKKFNKILTVLTAISFLLLTAFYVYMFLPESEKPETKTPERKWDKEYLPAVEVIGVKRDTILSLDYGSGNKEKGFDPDYYRAKGRCTYCLNLTNDNKTGLLFDNDNRGMMFDFYNKRFLLIDFKTGKIDPQSLRNFDLLEKSCENNVSMRRDPISGRIFISTIDKYFPINDKMDEVLNEEAVNPLVGSRTILLKGSDYYDKLERLKKRNEKTYKKLIDSSFDFDSKGNVYAGYYAGGHVSIFRLEKDGKNFRHFALIKLKGKKEGRFTKKMKLFAGKNNLYAVVSFENNLGELVSIEKTTGKKAITKKIRLRNFSDFTINDDSLYTWDDTFYTKRFHIYRYDL